MTQRRYVALLRGINVGKAKRVAMADLRLWLADLGFSEIKTLLNSGNVVFSAEGATPRDLATAIAGAIEQRGKVACPVVVLSEEDVRLIADENPFAEIAENPSHLLISIFTESEASAIKALQEYESKDWGAESLAVGSRSSYVYSPDGVLKSEALKVVEKVLSSKFTTRNWRTFEKIVALL